MPKRVNIDEVANAAVEAAAKKKQKLEAHRVANKKHYANLSAEKKAARSQRNSAGNKERMESRNDDEKEQFRANDRRRKKVSREAKKNGTKLKPGSQSVAIKKPIVYSHEDEKPTANGYGKADLIEWSKLDDNNKHRYRRYGVWSCKFCSDVYFSESSCVQHEQRYCTKKNDNDGK